MELTVRLKDQAPHALPHGAFFRIDPQDRGALRQGNIALIHSPPTGDKNRKPVARVSEAISGTVAMFSRMSLRSSGLRIHQYLNARGELSSSRPTAPAWPRPDVSPSIPHRACR